MNKVKTVEFTFDLIIETCVEKSNLILKFKKFKI